MVTVDAASPFVAFGDSITDPAAFDWPRVASGLVDQINALFTQPAPSANRGTVTGRVATATGRVATAATVAQTPKTLNYISDHALTAQSGWTTGNLLAQLPTALATYHPKVVLLHIGINDIANGGSPTNPFQSNYNSILDTIHAADATTQVIVVGMMAHWEQWDNVTGWSPGPNIDDASIAIANTFLSGLPAARPGYVTYIDVRTPLLALEKVNNVSPVVGSVVGQQDGVYIFVDTHGVHPLTNLKQLMAGRVMPFIQVTP